MIFLDLSTTPRITIFGAQPLSRMPFQMVTSTFLRKNRVVTLTPRRHLTVLLYCDPNTKTFTSSWQFHLKQTKFFKSWEFFLPGPTTLGFHCQRLPAQYFKSESAICRVTYTANCAIAERYCCGAPLYSDTKAFSLSQYRSRDRCPKIPF